MVAKQWRDLLPPEVRYSVANFDLQTQFNKAMAHADKVHQSVKAVAAASAAASVAAVALDVNHAMDADSGPMPQRRTARNRPRWRNIAQLDRPLEQSHQEEVDVELDKFEIHTDFESGEFLEMAAILDPAMKMEARKK